MGLLWWDFRNFSPKAIGTKLAGVKELPEDKKFLKKNFKIFPKKNFFFFKFFQKKFQFSLSGKNSLLKFFSQFLGNFSRYFWRIFTIVIDHFRTLCLAGGNFSRLSAFKKSKIFNPSLSKIDCFVRRAFSRNSQFSVLRRWSRYATLDHRPACARPWHRISISSQFLYYEEF